MRYYYYYYPVTKTIRLQSVVNDNLTIISLFFKILVNIFFMFQAATFIIYI